MSQAKEYNSTPLASHSCTSESCSAELPNVQVSDTTNDDRYSFAG